MAETLPDFHPSYNDTEERRFSFLKKRMKTSKISRRELQQNFACKGWNALSSFETQTDDESEYQILSSPPKIYLTSEMTENASKRKPMLVEINNIESAFKENKLKTLKDCNRNPQNFHNFVQMLYKDKLHATIHRKRLSSGSFNVVEMQELFPAKKAHFEDFHRNHDSSKVKPLSVNEKHSKYVLQPSDTNENKFQNFSKSFNSTPEKCSNENSELGILIQNESSPVNENKISRFKKINNGCFNIKNKFKTLSEAFNYDSSDNCVNRNSDVISKRQFDTMICSKKECPKKIIPVNDTSGKKGKNLNSIFTSHSANRKVGNTNSNADIFIKLKSSPVTNKMPIDTLHSSHLSAFESTEETSNLTSHKADIKIYNSKTFVQILQSSYQEKSFADKGSSWVQSLHWTDVNESKDFSSENIDQAGKKGLKNIISGGFAEQMLKLQRKERSDRVIWNHKMNELKEKTGISFITLTLASILHLGEIIVTMCCLHDSSKLSIKDILSDSNLKAQALDSELPALKTCSISSCDKQLQDTDSKQLIVLFQKSTFCKLQLKMKDVFVIYPPWQTISVPSLPAPVILCTYFVDFLHKSQEVVHKEILAHQPQLFCTGVHYTLQAKETESDNFLFTDNIFISDLYDKSICISARIQRIWKNRILSEKVRDIFKIENYLSFSLLLQMQNGVFLELKICLDSLSHAFLNFLPDAEGHCFKFYDLRVSHRYNLKRSTKFLKMLQIIQNQNERNSTLDPSQIFCYCFTPSSFTKMPDQISDENFPHYCSFDVKPLSFLQRSGFEGIRFSSIGKVLFTNKGDVYISDESLLCSKLKKYYKLKFASPFKQMERLIGTATVFIKEALFTGDFIFIDQYSCIQILSNNEIDKRLLPYQSRLKKISLVTVEHILTPLSLSSKVQEFVILTGTIIHVDENGAVSWLECSFCSGENLLEDSNSVIYCEDCSCIVPRPLLKVRMEVSINSSLPNTKIKIQLLSSTVKKILKISEDDFQPQCNISDVLNKSIGTVCCCIKDIEVVSCRKVFKLVESCY